DEAQRATARRAEEERVAVDARRKATENFGHFIGTASATLVGLFAYFLPSIVGRRKRNSGAIFVMNLFLGWMCIGWVIALVGACTKDSSMETLADQHLENLSRRGRGPNPDRLPKGDGHGRYLE